MGLGLILGGFRFRDFRAVRVERLGVIGVTVRF